MMISIQSVSFAYKISNNLWVGSAPPIKSTHEHLYNKNILSNDFDVLVLCAREYQPARDLFDVNKVILAPMNDDNRCMTKECARTALRTAKLVSERIINNERVLVTCLAGINRSSLVCALSLCIDPYMMSPSDAVELVRKARGGIALSNGLFVSFINSEPFDKAI